jgi:hypothetical protein
MKIPALITLADMAPEYREAEIYYTALINRKYNEIKSFDFHSNSGSRKRYCRNSQRWIPYTNLLKKS